MSISRFALRGLLSKARVLLVTGAELSSILRFWKSQHPKETAMHERFAAEIGRGLLITFADSKCVLRPVSFELFILKLEDLI